MTEQAISDSVNKMIFERQLGHKEELPGSGQWRMLTEANQKCWLCNNHIYTLVFWTESYAWAQSKFSRDF